MIADIQNLNNKRFHLRIILLSIKVLWPFPRVDFEYVVVWSVPSNFSAYRSDSEAIQIACRQNIERSVTPLHSNHHFDNRRLVNLHPLGEIIFYHIES